MAVRWSLSAFFTLLVRPDAAGGRVPVRVDRLPDVERAPHVVPLRRTVPVAASSVLARLLTGPSTAGHVVLTGAHAAYVATLSGAFAVVSTGAVVPSTTLVLAAGLRPDDLLPAGTEVTVGSGCVLVPPVDGRGPATVLRPARWWEPARVRPGLLVPSALLALRAVTGPDADLPATVVHVRAAGRRAAADLVAGRPDDAAAHLRSVLGFGPGTTPSGDDVAAGLLLAAHALLQDDAGRSAVRRVAAAVTASTHQRTGAVSAAMLAEARRGRGASVVVRAVNALTGHGDPRPAFDELLELGHHSGHDLAAGMLALATAVRARDASVR